MATILIVENDSHLAHLTSLIIARAGHAAAVVPDALTALEALESLQFDLLVVNMGLRGPVGGAELIGLVKSKLENSAIRFIALSDDMESGALERANPAGASAVISRLYKPSELTRVLDSVLLLRA